MTEATAVPPTELSRPIALTVMRGALRLLSATAPGVASRVAADLFMTPRRFPAPPREQEILAQGTPFTVRLGASTRSARLAFRRRAGGAARPRMGRPRLAAHAVRRAARRARLLGGDVRCARPRRLARLALVAPALRLGHPRSGRRRRRAARDHRPLPRLRRRDAGPARRALRRIASSIIAPPLNPVDYTARFGDILGLDDATIRGLQKRIEERFARKWSDYSLEESARLMTAPLLVVHDREDRDTFWSEGAATRRSLAGSTAH